MLRVVAPEERTKQRVEGREHPTQNKNIQCSSYMVCLHQKLRSHKGKTVGGMSRVVRSEYLAMNLLNKTKHETTVNIKLTSFWSTFVGKTGITSNSTFSHSSAATEKNQKFLVYIQCVMTFKNYIFPAKITKLQLKFCFGNSG